MKRMSNIIFSWLQPEEKAMKFVAVVFALTLVALALPSTTWAGSIFHVSGPTVDAGFSSLYQFQLRSV